MFELKGKTALVTGCAKRIGHAVALGLAKQGVNIVAHYRRSSEDIEKLRTELTQLGVKSWLVQGDLSKPGVPERMADEAFEKAGKVDILINNASIFSAKSLDDTKLEDINLEMSVNTWAPFLLSRQFGMKATQGKIINMLDTRISGYDFNHFAYYLSKKMLENLTNSMALKLAPNVTVNALAPGLILPPEGKDISYLEQKSKIVPLKKHGSTDDIVEAILFLLRSDFITGQIIYVDGGMHLMQTLEGLS